MRYVVHNKAREGLDMTTTMTICLDSASKSRLERLPRATERSKSFLAAQAIRAYLDSNEWQVQEVRAALAESDAGDFALAAVGATVVATALSTQPQPVSPARWLLQMVRPATRNSGHAWLGHGADRHCLCG